jgi:hypothetical protein
MLDVKGEGGREKGKTSSASPLSHASLLARKGLVFNHISREMWYKNAGH